MKEIITYQEFVNKYNTTLEIMSEEYISIGKTSRKYYICNNPASRYNGMLGFAYKKCVHHITDKENIPYKALKVQSTADGAKLKAREVEVDFTSKKQETKIVKHEKFDQIKTCIQCDIPVYLVGEAGTGKNFTLEQIAREMGLQFYFTNSVQQEYKLTGFIDAGGKFHETEFYKAFKNGGLFFLDEIDASIPEVLVLLNAAIANRYFEFPIGRIQAHPDFRVVAAGNTVGSGADELYTGRLVLDQATLDRFVVIDFDYDRNVEMNLAHGNEQLVNFVRGLRRFAKENGVRATFSYRCIITTTKLMEQGMNLKTILQIAIFKGLDKDTVNTFRTDLNKDGSSGKFYYALKELQGAA